MSNVLKCIFCMKEMEKGSEEHIFPDSLGGLLVIYNVCKRCNDKLGQKVDSHLVNHQLMQFSRLTKKLKGKKGKIPNPLGRGHLQNDPETTVHYKFTDEGKPESLYVVPKVKSENGHYNVIADASEPDRVVDMVNKFLKRNNQVTKSREEILSSAKYVSDKNPRMQINMNFDINNYRKAILKITYEMAYYWLGKNYLDDKMGEKIRNYILSDDLDVEGLNGYADLVDDKKNGLTSLADDNSHIAVLKKDGNKLYCYVNLFNLFHGGLVVSEQAEKYTNHEDRFLINDVVKREIRENRLEDELLRER
ncbi:HNH endonuclease [Priestia megaterium]|uniref:HNH endonuclease n=1 Tax=Priestia megaterium TaxID=1404 RepID=UPI002FFF3CAF